MTTTTTESEPFLTGMPDKPVRRYLTYSSCSFDEAVLFGNCRNDIIIIFILANWHGSITNTLPEWFRQQTSNNNYYSICVVSLHLKFRSTERDVDKDSRLVLLEPFRSCWRFHYYFYCAPSHFVLFIDYV